MLKLMQCEWCARTIRDLQCNVCLRGAFITTKPYIHNYTWFSQEIIVRFKQVKYLYISIIGYNFCVRCPKKRGVQITQVLKWYKIMRNKTGVKKTVRFSEVSGLSRCPVLRFLCTLLYDFKVLIKVHPTWFVPRYNISTNNKGCLCLNQLFVSGQF